jgi:hypothetical protein
MTNTFLPENYEAPKTNSNYMKFEKGENRFRILSRPIIGWEDWTDDKKPVRFLPNQKPDKPINANRPIKFFWAMVVFNWFKNDIQILQITQRSIQDSIEKLAKDSDWGNPFFYDIKVSRSGDGMETEYTVNPAPKKDLPIEVYALFKAKPIYLPALYQGADPFINHGEITPLNDIF